MGGVRQRVVVVRRRVAKHPAAFDRVVVVRAAVDWVVFDRVCCHPAGRAVGWGGHQLLVGYHLLGHQSLVGRLATATVLPQERVALTVGYSAGNRPRRRHRVAWQAACWDGSIRGND